MPFQPLPAYMALPALEWGINWCVANRANQYLMLHSAVVEKRGSAIVFPAWPGHGKTTLCAGLMLSGWRLLFRRIRAVEAPHGNIGAIAEASASKERID